MTPEVHVVRALNACRPWHRPTYVGLRLLLNSESDRGRVAWVSEMARRKAYSRTDWRYYKYRVLKEVAANGMPVYRDCVVGSPTTLLCESYVLALMARESVFAPSKNVYSHLWPRSEVSGRNFQYYHYGYSLRNYRIAAQLRRGGDRVAVIADIRRFYPSVDWGVLEPKIVECLNNVSSPLRRRAIGGFLYGLRPEDRHGIPIGTDVSHVLGKLALADVDARLEEEFGDRYFRYVDDIVVVCDRRESGRVMQTIKECVGGVGLELHEGKCDVVPSAVWLSECPGLSCQAAFGAFEELLQDVCLYVLVRPKQFKSLRRVFAEEGISLPFSRIRSQMEYPPYWRYLLSMLYRGRGRCLAEAMFSQVESFVVRAKAVRESLESALKQYGGRLAALSGMERRWCVQRCRYSINRLLYLCDREDYERLDCLIREGQEFEEYRRLLRALRTGDISGVIRLPGHVLATFCELASERMAPMMPSELPDLRDRSIAEGVTLLALYFGWKVPDTQKMQMYRGSRMLLEMCSGNEVNEDRPDPMTFLDEMELLFRGASQERLAKLARTRFSEREEVGLAGLWLGGYGLS